MIMNKQTGFTLIELMIVVAILGILASVAIPAYQIYIARSQTQEALSLTSGYKTMTVETYHSTGNCPVNGVDDTPAFSAISGAYVEGVSFDQDGSGQCTLTAQFRMSNVAIPLRGKHITLTMSKADVAYIGWSCSSSDLKQEYLPKSCTGLP